MTIGILIEDDTAALMIPARLKNEDKFIVLVSYHQRFSPNKVYPFNIRGTLKEINMEAITGEFILGAYHKGNYSNYSPLYVCRLIRETPLEALKAVISIERMIDIDWEGDYITLNSVIVNET